MEQEKSEKPTPKKIKEAKKRGDAPRSVSLTAALTIAFALGCFTFFAPHYTSYFRLLFAKAFIGDRGVVTLAGQLARVTFYFLVALVVVVIITKLLQQGWVFSWPRKIGRGTQEKEGFFLVKLSLWGAVLAFFCFFPKAVLSSLPLEEKITTLFKHLFLALWVFALLFLVVGLLDYLYQRKRFFDALKMSKQEVQEEQKEREGDGLTKGRMRNKK